MTDLIISPVFTVAIDVTLLLAQTQQYRRIRCVSKTGAILQVDARVCVGRARRGVSGPRPGGRRSDVVHHAVRVWLRHHAKRKY